MPPAPNPFPGTYPPVQVEDFPWPPSGAPSPPYRQGENAGWVEWLYENLRGLLSGGGGTQELPPDPLGQGQNLRPDFHNPNRNINPPPAVPLPRTISAPMRQTAPGGVSALNVEPPGAPMLPAPTVLPTENVTAGRLPYRKEFPARTQDFYDQLAERSLMQGENAAMANREIQQNTLLGGGINLGDVWQKGKDIFFSDPMQEFFRTSRDALAQPARFGDWGMEPYVRAQVARESATAAAQQETALELIKKGIDPVTGQPLASADPPISESWHLGLLQKINGGSQALRALQRMKETAISAQTGDVWGNLARALKEVGEFWGIDITGLDSRQILKAWRAQVIMTLAQSGMFGKEMSSLDYETLESAMGPTPGVTLDSKEVINYITRMEEFVGGQLEGLSKSAVHSGLEEPLKDVMEGGMTFRTGPGGSVAESVKRSIREDIETEIPEKSITGDAVPF